MSDSNLSFLVPRTEQRRKAPVIRYQEPLPERAPDYAQRVAQAVPAMVRCPECNARTRSLDFHRERCPGAPCKKCGKWDPDCYCNSPLKGLENITREDVRRAFGD